MGKRRGLGCFGIQLQKARYTGLRSRFSRFAENIEKLQAESATLASVEAIASAFVYPRDPNQIHTQKTKTKIPVLKGTRMNFTNNTFFERDVPFMSKAQSLKNGNVSSDAPLKTSRFLYRKKSK